MLLVGLDASSDWRNFGFAIGQYQSSRITIEQSGIVGTKTNPVALDTIIGPELRTASQALLAIDAPLGWPTKLGPALAGHQAGEVINGSKGALFHRATDDFIQTTIKKRPLEVGADRIARAAHSALDSISRLSRSCEKPIPLAWDTAIEGISAIEVYPAATLRTHDVIHQGYKENVEVRRGIARALSGQISNLDSQVDQEIHVFDACLCLLAAKDFLEDACYPPQDEFIARKEGWIWVRRLSSEEPT